MPTVNNSLGDPRELGGVQLRGPQDDRQREAGQPIDREQLSKWTELLNKYKAGKSRTDSRIISAENWWKLHNEHEEVFKQGTAQWSGFRSASGWLHNVIMNKHADAMDSEPVPTILPRERTDEQEAKLLTSIVPAIMEMCDFPQVYSDAMWQKIKYGTAVYRIAWDGQKLGGLGDISISTANLLNLYWEPGVTDIQQSKVFFDTELVDRDMLSAEYPDVSERQLSTGFTSARFQYDDSVSTDGKVMVIGVYYHKGGKLHYCKYCGDTVLTATENDPNFADTGIYDHGMYPFVFDTLFPIEGSPCGYGYVDVCCNPQTEIDLMRTAILRNAMAGTTPRAFVRADGSINEQEYLDLTKPVVHVSGNLGEDSIRIIPHSGLDGNYISVLQETINELRETTGNTEASTGTASSGITAASAIAALQEASGKSSRDFVRGTYRAYRKVVEFCIELIRQFYDVPRQFRIVGQFGIQGFVEYSNQNIVPQDQGQNFGVDMGYRLPTFDISIDAQKKSTYSTLTQNELALQFFQLGFFNPQLCDQALACIEIMEFTGKEKVQQMVSSNGTLYQQNQLLMQYAATLAMQHGDQAALQQIASMSGATVAGMPTGGLDKAKLEADDESSTTSNARRRTQESTQVD